MKRITKMCLLALCALWVCLLPLRAQADEVDLTRVPVLSVDENGNTYFTGETRDMSVEQPELLSQGGISTCTMGEMREDGWTYLTFTTFEDLKELASRSYGPRYSQALYMGEDPLTISEDLTIPQYLSIICEDAVVIPQGVTLTVDGALSALSLEVNGRLELLAEHYSSLSVQNLTIHGNVKNAGSIYLGAELSVEAIETKITVSEGGSYTGPGRLDIYAAQDTYQSVEAMWNDCVSGLNLVDFELSNHETFSWGDEYESYSSEYWQFRIIKGLTKLDAPTGLKWGYDVYWDREHKQVLTEEPGSICFETTGLHQGEWEITVFNAEGDRIDGGILSMYHVNDGYEQRYLDYDTWHTWMDESSLESGTYYYTVRALGDYIAYYDSDVVRSEDWTYVAPEANMEVPANVVRNGTTFSWDPVEGADWYAYKIRYANTENAEPWIIGRGLWYSCSVTLGEWTWENGAGYYYFSVRTQSDDLNQRQHSDWSEELVFYFDPAEGVVDSLNNIAATAETPEEIKSAVQALDTNTLKNAMAADTDNSGAMDTLSRLEEKVGGPADVAVAEEVPAFDADKVSIVGANLNTTSTEGGVTLNIAKPEKEHILDTRYNSALAVSFSMDLENVEDTENLQVPVKITLPIPSNINPSFLVLLHYHADGTMESVVPHIFYQDGQAYAAFILTSFSDFVMTEMVAPEVNRVAGDDRYATAIKTAEELKAVLGVEKFNAIIVASGSNFADALAGSYLSTVKSAPILLSWGKGGKHADLDTTNLTYIKNNLAEGGTVYILGGINAVPDLYKNELAGYNVKRLGGQDRFETNRKILAEAGVPADSEILVCTGKSFPDSLSASAVGKPILLVMEHNGQPYGIDDAYLKSLQGCRFTIIGGASAVSENLANKLAAYGSTYRLAGDNRFSTSILVAEKYFDTSTSAVLAYARNYPDGLCGGALAYAKKAPLILTMDGAEEEAVAYTHKNGITDGTVLGGSGLIGDAAVRSIFNMAEDAVIIKK